MNTIQRLVAVICLLINSFAYAGWQEKPQVQAFINDMVTTHHFSRASLNTLFGGISFNQAILKIVLPSPHKGKYPITWYQYRQRFITPWAIDKGRVFWQKYAKTLKVAAAHYQVDPALIVGTLGIESRYGTYTGNFSTLQALVTLAFAFPRRAHFFQQELTAFLLLTRQYHVDPKCIKGSYAGAIGPGQFMPSNLLKYADLQKQMTCSSLISLKQAIWDIARFYHAHSWIAGAPVVSSAVVTGKQYLTLPVQTQQPHMKLGQFKQYGITSAMQLPADTRASFFVLSGHDDIPEYWLTFHNFYVITRYNHSIKYAMAVYQLGQLIAKSTS